MGYQDEVRARRKKQKVQNIQKYLTNPQLIATRLGRLGIEPTSVEAPLSPATPLRPQWGVPATTPGARMIYKPTPNLASMIAAGGPAPPLVGLRPEQRLPDAYSQMIAGRGYAEPISPLGTYSYPTGTILPGQVTPSLPQSSPDQITPPPLTELQSRQTARARTFFPNVYGPSSPEVEPPPMSPLQAARFARGRALHPTQPSTAIAPPQVTPPILYSPETERIADQIMGQERAKFAAKPRGPLSTQSWTSVPGQAPTAGYGQSLPPVGVEPIGNRFGGYMEPTRLAPSPEEPSSVERPEERYARIQAAIEAGGRDLASSRVKPGATGYLSDYTRDVAAALAGIEGAKMPAAYRGAPGSTIAQAKPQGITREERLAKRRTEMDIRSRIAESNRVGRPITRQQAQMMAQLQGKVLSGEPLTAMETISTMSPEQQATLGPAGIAAVLEAAPERLKAAEKAAQLSALAQTAGAYAKEGMETPDWIREAMTTIGGPSGRTSSKGGPVTIPGAAPPAGAPQRTVDPERMASIDKMAEQLPEDVLDDPLETERRLVARGADQAALDAWGTARYGRAAWQARKVITARLPVVSAGHRIGTSLIESGINPWEAAKWVADPFGLFRRITAQR